MALEFYTSPSGSGFGTGTVTSVATQSQSLRDITAPNPIVGSGIIDFEIQIIDKTKAAIQALEAANTLLAGVTYRITDFNKSIGNITLDVADFITVKGSGVVKILSTNGNAYSNTGGKYEISYDLASDFLMMVYLPSLNQRSSRLLGSARNCIEQIDWENTNWQNIEVIETDFVNNAAGTIFTNTFATNATINWGGFASTINGCFLYDLSVIFFVAVVTVRSLTLLQNSQASIEEQATNGIIEANGSLSVVAGFGMNGFRIGANSIVVSNNAITQNDIAADFNTNELVQVFAAAAIAEQIFSSLCSNINVNIDPSAFGVGYSINLPQFPYHRQIVNIGWNSACATATGIVTATFAGGGVIVPLLACQKGQCISYQYHANIATWYLI
jgi:hypothetical protein